MPTFGTMTINDGQATPAAHAFEAITSDAGVSRYQDLSSGVPIGYPKIIIGRREPVKDGSGVFKVSVSIDVPTLEQTSASTATGIQPAPTVAYVTAFRGDFLLPSRSSTANRKDILAYVKNALATSVMTDLVVDLKAIN